MRIGIDIDGVLTDLEQWQLDYGSKFYYEKYRKTIVNHKGYETDDIFKVAQKYDDEFWLEYLEEYARNAHVRLFASEVIKKLKDDGHEIYIITARYLTDKKDDLGELMRSVVKLWLEQKEIYYDKIIFSKENKLDTCIQNNITLMIDDKVKNIKTISKKIPVICFHAGYNEKCRGRNIIRCYSWYDIYAKIKELAEKNNRN